jgi:hypothetical protein
MAPESFAGATQSGPLLTERSTRLHADRFPIVALLGELPEDAFYFVAATVWAVAHEGGALPADEQKALAALGAVCDTYCRTHET